MPGINGCLERDDVMIPAFKKREREREKNKLLAVTAVYTVSKNTRHKLMGNRAAESNMTGK